MLLGLMCVEKIVPLPPIMVRLYIYLGLFTTSAWWYLLKCKVLPSKYFSV